VWVLPVGVGVVGAGVGVWVAIGGGACPIHPANITTAMIATITIEPAVFFIIFYNLFSHSYAI